MPKKLKFGYGLSSSLRCGTVALQRVMGYGIVLIVFLLIAHNSLLITTIYARTTPEDILNAKKLVSEEKVRRYSLANRQKLESLSKRIADFNREKTSYLEYLVLRQGEILDEFIKRNNIQEDGGKDGVNRSNDPIAVTRIEITRAHEAIAYQAAKVYIFNLTSEKNIKQDALNLISSFQADLNLARNKAVYSQGLLENLLEKNEQSSFLRK